MKLLTTIHRLENYQKLALEADGFVVGVKDFSTRETSFLTKAEITKLATWTKRDQKELYLSIKAFLHQQGEELLKFLASLEVELTGIIVGDIGYYYLLKALKIPLIYQPETLITNTNDLNIYYETGFKGVFLGKEITLKDLLEMTLKSKAKTYLLGHGHFNMFYSKRMLLSSYFKEIKKDLKVKDQTFFLKEEKRAEYLPVMEDQFGTHIYRSDVSSVIDYLKDLNNIDYFLIDSIFYDDDYGVDVLKMFKGKKTKEELLNKYQQVWDEGFLKTKTIYKRGQDD
ncbi:MAG TPA: hypothetical protein GX001_04275 [Acholeplasmataceae bacterium]|nr:hypothetical protein [Acholeplasmataceae bacterium]